MPTTTKWKNADLNWKPRKPRKSKSPHKRLIEDLDEWVSRIIRDRDKQCVLCGSRDRLTNGHVLPGRYLALRFDIRPDGNCHAQCWPCNYRHISHQADYYNWYIDKFGLERWKRLNREYYTNPKIPTDKELRILLEQLKTNYDYLNY